nr:immunoglobulin heavy chain junction region [Mus musculus]NSM04061.1 immunoglobulin heavy chain junction region [Mus musculus]NSM04671.1 immunoglobulin heavy chain junction region [Mus musculus]NSM04909.1 immunoglobulin heavy chain junction region [Mus musculus]NSM05193.1 immunoglobulin heavy chain junction region [Mus musculus]
CTTHYYDYDDYDMDYW